MFNRLLRGREFKRHYQDLRATMAAAPIGFAVTLLDEYEGICAELDLEKGSLAYGRHFSSPQTQTLTSPLSDLVLLIEGSCFFCHYLNRVTFRGTDGRLWNSVARPLIGEIAALVSEMISVTPDVGGSMTKAQMIDCINDREILYSSKPTVFGDSADDPDSVVGLAGQTIAEVLERPDSAILPMMITTALMRRCVEVNFHDVVLKIEKCL